MKSMMMIMAVLSACGLFLGCGGNGENDCDKADKIRKAGLDEGCDGRNDECWYCRCYNQDQQVDVQVEGTEVTYACKNPDPCVDNPDTPDIDECNPACEGTSLTAAEQCLSDEETCKQDHIDMQNNGCDATQM